MPYTARGRSDILMMKWTFLAEFPPALDDIVKEIQDAESTARREERERIASLAEKESRDMQGDSDYWTGYCTACRNIAGGVRSLIEPTEGGEGEGDG